MKRILFALLISIISLGNISCKAQDNIGWVQSDIVYENINYGLLYNWYAATDARNIANTGWHLPSDSDFLILRTYLGGFNEAGGHSKSIGFDFWDYPNTGADNSSGFNGKGIGYRDSNGAFAELKLQGYWHSSNNYNTGVASGLALLYNQASFTRWYGTTGDLSKKFGAGIRIIKDYTTLTSGQTGTYYGNDGKIYRTICINGVEWLADNLAETKYRDGTDIPQVTDATTWSGLTTGAWCYYNNDPTKK